MARTMRTFFDVNAEHPDEFILLDVSESHHLTKVLRLTEGDEIEALDGKGCKYKTKIASIERKFVKLQILEKEFFNDSQLNFHLAIALLKGNRWEDMIRPLTELGVSRLTPLHTDRSESKIEGRKQDMKIKKWERVAIDACKQSGNPWIPIFDNPQTLSSLIQDHAKGENVFLGSLSSGARPFKDFKLENQKNITILIGPEGGWSAEEENLAKSNGIKFFSLGLNTLRVETAALSALAVARESFLL